MAAPPMIASNTCKTPTGFSAHITRDIIADATILLAMNIQSILKLKLLNAKYLIIRAIRA